MPTEADLTTLRLELKRKLSDGTYDPLAERIVKWGKRVFPRLAQNDFALYLALSLGNLAICAPLNLFDGSAAFKSRLTYTIIGAFGVWIGPFLYARLCCQLYHALSGHVIDSLPQARDVADLSRALALFSNPFLSALFVTAYTVYVTPYIIALMPAKYGAFGFIAALGIANAQWIMGVILYHVLFLMLFPLVLSRYYIDLYELDPGASPSIRDLSLVIRDSSYQISVYATLFTVYIFYIIQLQIIILASVFLLPVLGIFIFRQVSLHLIIARARWAVLERLSARMEKLDAKRHFDNPAIQNQYKAMLDYYNRVKNAETGVFDARTATLLFNSFLLPLIAFLLFQYDKIVAFVGRFIH